MPIIKEDPFHKYPSNFNVLKEEVSEGMREDWKHELVDNTKKRAIKDARNYDDFKARVAGCELKPVNMHEFNAPPKFTFNKSAGGAGLRATPPMSQIVSSNISSGASTRRDFERRFRRESAEGKIALLRSLDAELCGEFFGRDMDPEVLRQLLVTLEEVGRNGTQVGARMLLAALSVSCPSAIVAASSFLTTSERGVVSQLLAREPGTLSGRHSGCRVVLPKF